jgi:hypothetical protein
MRRFYALGFAVLAISLSFETFAQTTFTSGTGTSVEGLGNAQAVCLNASYPSPCPAGATLWGYAGGGWTQDLAPIPGAVWIWAPGLTATDPSADAEYTFTNTVNVAGTPTSATVYMTADDYVELRVNGTLVDSVGSVTIPGAMPLGQFDVTPLVHTGSNTFSFTAKNGPASFGGTVYSTNPAGVVFGGSITEQVTPPPPVTPPAAVPVPAFNPWALLVLGLAIAALAVRGLRFH